MSQTRIQVWHKHFMEGHNTFKDLPHTGRPCSVRNNQNMNKVRQLHDLDEWLTVHKMAQELQVSKTSVHTMLKKDMNLSKIAPKMVPRVLTEEQKRFRVQLCEINLASIRDNPDLMKLVVTGDESWISVLKIETKRASCVWVPKGSTAACPCKAMHQRAARKAMLTVFFDTSGTILAEFLPRGETVCSESYIETLQRLRENIRRCRPQLWGADWERRATPISASSQ